MKDNIIERLDYTTSHDSIDVALHEYRYQLASNTIHGSKILEIGCGYGTNILSKKSGKLLIRAIDIDKQVIDFAKMNNSGNTNIEYLTADALNLPFESETFDAIVSIENIEHVNDSSKYLNELHRVLKKDGELFITTPNINRVENIYLKLQGKHYPKNPYHLHEFSMAELKNCLKTSKFRIILSRGIFFHITPLKDGFIKNLYIKYINTILKINFPLLSDYFMIYAKKI